MFYAVAIHDASISVYMWLVRVCVCVRCYFVSRPFSDNVSSIISIDSIYILHVVFISAGSFVQIFFSLKTKRIIFEIYLYKVIGNLMME